MLKNVTCVQENFYIPGRRGTLYQCAIVAELPEGAVKEIFKFMSIKVQNVKFAAIIEARKHCAFTI